MNMRTPPSLLEEEKREGQPPIPPPQEVDFSEYMWMAEELEEFDRQVEEELWEQAFIEACFEDMLAEEELHWYFSQHPQSYSTVPITSWVPPSEGLMPFDCKGEELLQSSRLNPEAPEFVPAAVRSVK